MKRSSKIILLVIVIVILAIAVRYYGIL